MCGAFPPGARAYNNPQGHYDTGFTLDSIGSMSEQMGISALLGQTFGVTNGNYFARPQHTFNIDNIYFLTLGDATHDVKFGFGYRRTDIFSQTVKKRPQDTRSCGRFHAVLPTKVLHCD